MKRPFDPLLVPRARIVEACNAALARLAALDQTPVEQIEEALGVV